MNDIHPKMLKKFNLFILPSKKDFSLELLNFFEPQDDSLWFHLLDSPPIWLRIDAKKGLIYGTAPDIPENRDYPLKIQASNKAGFIQHTFILRVVPELELEDPKTLTNILSVKRERQPTSHLHPYTPDILEYLFYFYQHPEKLAKAFEKSFRKFAEENKIKLPQKIDYKAFKEALTKVHPNLEVDLQARARQQLRENQAILKEAINNEELQILFRQGSQQQGVITIPVWNNLGAPSLHNRTSWSAVDNVLDMASTKLARRMTRTQEAENKLQETQHQKFQFEKEAQQKQSQANDPNKPENKTAPTPELRPPFKR